MKISTRKSDKNKLSSKINENLSSKNNHIIDENQNNLNSSKNINNNLIEKSKENLQNLKYIFPFLKEELNNSKNKDNNYSLSEYNKIVISINKNE